MSEPFIAEIRIFGFNFPPRGWAFCEGQLLPIAQNTALFALVGTTYGGDGRTIFGLPDLRGRGPMHWGTGPGLSPHAIGQKAGAVSTTIDMAQMPLHNHVSDTSSTVEADLNAATSPDPTMHYLAATTRNVYGAATDLEFTGATAGGGQAHSNQQPFLGLHFSIALVGLFPSRS